MRTIIDLPGSKSITNRALLLAALAQGTSTLSNVLNCDDTLAMISCLKALGIDLQWDKARAEIIIKGCAGQWPNNQAKLFVNEAGTAARFLLAACAVTKGRYEIDAGLRMRNRPIKILLQILQQQNIEILSDSFPLKLMVKHALQGGLIEIDASESSQFASALMMAAPFAKNDTQLIIKNAVSEPYIFMTQHMMQDFGATIIEKNFKEFFIPCAQQYQARNYAIEPDASTASYFFAAAALMNKHIVIKNLHREKSLQGDLEFLSILEKMGCQVAQENNAIKVIGTQQLRGVEVDMKNCSDTFMTLAALAPFADTPTRITGIAHTRKQESDRVHAVATQLRGLNIQVEEGHDYLKIFPGNPKAGNIDPHNDHRIAMAFSVLQLKVPELIIQNPQVVNKTFPEFFVCWKNICY